MSDRPIQHRDPRTGDDTRMSQPEARTAPAPATLQKDPLGELRDIHLPEPVPAWPPAPGWWLLAVLAAASLALAIGAIVRHRRRNRYRREAIRELELLFVHCQRDHDERRYLRGCAELLKRVVLLHYPRPDVAALTGEEWVAFLDQVGDTREFTLGAGQALIQGPYAPDSTIDMAGLHRLALKWLDSHRFTGSSSQSARRIRLLPGSLRRRRVTA